MKKSIQSIITKLSILVVSITLFGCDTETTNNTSNSISVTKGPITLIDAYIPYRDEQQNHFAAYFEIKNTSNKEVTITGVNTPAFAHSMLHETVFEDNMAKMKSIQPLTLAPNQTVTFKPKGKHVMLMKSIRDLSKQDGIKLNLALDTSEILQFEIDFEKPNTQ